MQLRTATLVAACLSSPFLSSLWSSAWAAHANGASPQAPGEACMQAIDGLVRERLGREGLGRGEMGHRPHHPPAQLLAAIGRVESGRIDAQSGTVRPWPWTINAEGRGALFASKDQAIAAVQALHAKGVVSIDVGCMQINLMHHPAAFASLDEAFDPAANVRYAAQFLNVLYRETKDWDIAAAYYHSRTASRAAPYQQKVIAAMGGGRLPPAIPRASPLANAWAATLAPSAGSWTVRRRAVLVRDPRPGPAARRFASAGTR